MSTQPIQIIRASDGELVDAKLYEGLRAVDLTLIERQWGTWRQDIARRLADCGIDHQQWPQSLHWDWFAKSRQLQLLAVEVFAIDFEKEWQGVTLVDSVTHRCQLDSQRDKNLLYVDYIETAPWNWSVPHIGVVRRFKGLGNILMRRVIQRSFELGFKGRVGLNALPQANDFYGARLGMSCIKATKIDDLDYFELSEVSALELIKKET